LQRRARRVQTPRGVAPHAVRKSNDSIHSTRRHQILLCVLCVLWLLPGCKSRASQPQQPERTILWRTLGAFSGRGNRQTESFTSDTGTLRVTWEVSGTDPGRTRDGPGSVPGPSPFFRLTAHSAISGRPLQQVVDTSSAGKGIGYVQQ